MSNQVQLTFPDGAVKSFDAGVTLEEVASSISSGLKKTSVSW